MPLKIGCLVTGMLMGADSIDDMNVLRDGGLHHVFAEVGGARRSAASARSATATSASWTRCTGGCWLAWPPVLLCCPARTCWPTSTSTPASAASTG